MSNNDRPVNASKVEIVINSDQDPAAIARRVLDELTRVGSHVKTKPTPERHTCEVLGVIKLDPLDVALKAIAYKLNAPADPHGLYDAEWQDALTALQKDRQAAALSALYILRGWLERADGLWGIDHEDFFDTLVKRIKAGELP